MSHRMSVLSRRLERFAVGFTIATFAFFLLGFYAGANDKGKVVIFFFAGLASVCLFASFFLWVAHGFAWAMIPEKPGEARKPAEELMPAEALRPAEAMKPADALKPVEALMPAEVLKPVDALEPAEAMKPAEAKRPVEAMKAADEKKPAEEIKPVEEKVTAPEEDPPDAQYTITGRRIY